MTREHIPRLALIYGLAGLIPFSAPVLVAWRDPALAGSMGRVLAAYAAMILAFLAGGRWGFAVQPPADRRSITIAMLPPVIGWLLLCWPAMTPKLVVLAMAHAAQGGWDIMSHTPPPWYPRLRAILTCAAVTALLLASAVCR